MIRIYTYPSYSKTTAKSFTFLQEIKKGVNLQQKLTKKQNV